MPKSSRDAGRTPGSTSLTPGSEAVCLEHTGFPLMEGDTTCILTVEGTLSGVEGKYAMERIISNPRVPVLAPDGEPLMPTKASRARRWIEEGKAIPVKTKLVIFAVQLVEEPSGREKQPIVVGIDPGSKYTGIAVTSSKAIFCGFNLELPDYIKQRMDKRRELRRNRRYRKCRRRECRFLNRTGHKIAPSILARKQLELRVVKEVAKRYPVSAIAIENVRFNHYNKRYGKYFSQVEIGKNWLIAELEKTAPTKVFDGWETTIRRKEFDIIRRPKYSRRKLHLEQPSKRGVRRKYGGTTTPFVFRKGDYVEAKQGKKTVRGWVSGYIKNSISVSDFDWKRLGQFVVKKVRLLERNSGLLFKRKGGERGEFIPRLKPWVSFAGFL